MRLVQLSLVQLVVLCFVGFVTGQTPSQAKNSGPTDWGRVSEGKFSSPILGLTMSVPESFTLISSAEADLLGSAGADVLKQGNANKKIDDALSRTIRLLAVSEHPYGTPNNAALEMVAVKQRAGVTAKMSLTANVMLLKGTPFVLKATRTAVKIGTNSFEVADLEGEFSGILLKQRLFVMMHKGYSIMIAVTYGSEGQISAMEKVIATISLSR
jgi:hypothetical protein